MRGRHLRRGRPKRIFEKGVAMSEFVVNPERLDPYKGTNFQVYFGATITPIPGICHVSGLAWDTQVVRFREGGFANRFVLGPGLTTFEPVVLSRGRTHDTAFEEWAALVWSTENGVNTPMGLSEMRKEVRIDLLNEARQPVLRFILHRCWPSHYQPLGILDAGDTAIAVESMTLRYEGFERDLTVTEPKEP